MPYEIKKDKVFVTGPLTEAEIEDLVDDEGRLEVFIEVLTKEDTATYLNDPLQALEDCVEEGDDFDEPDVWADSPGVVGVRLLVD